MPPQLLFDISSLDLTRDVYDRQAIRKVNPQRGHMEHLDGIVYIDTALHRGIGYKDVRADEFWVPGHIPGRPLLPGVLMIEAAAQLASFYARTFQGFDGFMAFAAADDIKFRQEVTPGCRMYILIQCLALRHGRTQGREQGVVNGSIVFEATITGMQL
jgi:3-hydroxyacyl-[acyl-carrier-protein] dehydratase